MVRVGFALQRHNLTLASSGLKSINKVSSVTFVESTSSISLFRPPMRLRRDPDATDAGYSLAKLRRPRMAALRSSRSVALCKRPLNVAMVSAAVCLAGAWDSSIRNIAMVEVSLLIALRLT